MPALFPVSFPFPKRLIAATIIGPATWHLARRPENTTKLWALGCIMAFLFLASLANPSQAQLVTPARITRMQELRPQLKPEDTVLMVSQQRRTTRPGAFKLQDNTRLDSLMDTLKVYNQRIQTMPGYRLQVYTGVDREQAMRAKEVLYRTFPDLEVYVSFAQPTFQVRGGDFLTRLEALQGAHKLKGAFPSVVVVPDQVKARR